MIMLIRHLLLTAAILASRGELDAARALATRAVELIDGEETPSLKADALMDLARVHCHAREFAQSRAAADEAIRLYERKGNRAAAARAVRWRSDNLPA